MRITLALRAKHAPYQPMIRFLGHSRKEMEHPPHAPAPHPAAPQDIKDSFQSFLSKLQSTSGGPENPSSNPKGQDLASSAKGHVRPGDSSSGDSSRPSAGPNSGAAAGAGGGAKSPTGSDKTEGPIASKPADFDNFWEAPGYLWKIPEVSERESEAILSGGATDVRRRL